MKENMISVVADDEEIENAREFVCLHGKPTDLGQ